MLGKNQGVKRMNKDFFFDEEIEESYYERLESKIPIQELNMMREKYDQGWNEPKTKEKLSQIVESTQGLIDKRLLL